MTCDLHPGEAGFEAFADHQDFTGFGEANHAAAAGAEHHLLRLDGRLALTIAGKIGPVDRDGRAIDAACDQKFGTKLVHIFRVGGGAAVRIGGASRHARISG